MSRGRYMSSTLHVLRTFEVNVNNVNLQREAYNQTTRQSRIQREANNAKQITLATRAHNVSITNKEYGKEYFIQHRGA